MKTWEEKKIKYLEILENTNKTIEEIKVNLAKIKEFQNSQNKN